jgi:hypothetical protein
LLYCSGDFTGSDASCAYVLSGNGTAFLYLDGLDVYVPFSSGMTIGMGYIVSGNLALTTNLAFFRHILHLLLNPEGSVLSHEKVPQGNPLNSDKSHYSTAIQISAIFF